MNVLYFLGVQFTLAENNNIIYSIRKCHLHIWLNIFVIRETQDVKIKLFFICVCSSKL